MKLTEQQMELFEFVKEKHKTQVRKYTGEPYHNHCYEVAQILSTYGHDDCIEVALCHDLFEDTDCNFDSLYKKLLDIGYDIHVAYDICTHVNELTDKFTKENYPHLNRKNRKQREAKRLGSISVKSQTVKYADLINNTSSIVERDKDFSVVYLQEKKEILELMKYGDKKLYNFCCTLVGA